MTAFNSPPKSGSGFLAVVLGAVVTLVLLGGGALYYRAQIREIHQNSCEQIAIVARMKVGQIEQWRKDRLEDVVREAHSPTLIKTLGMIAKNADTPETRESAQVIVRLAQMKGRYSHALVLSQSGQVLFSAGDGPVSITPSTQQAVVAALSAPEGVISDFFRNPDGEVYIDTVAAIRDGEGTALGSVILRSKAGDFLYPLIQSWPIRSRSAETLLVEREGDQVVFLNELRHRSNTALILREPLSKTEVPAVQAVLGKRGVIEGRDYRDIKVIAYLNAIPGSPWILVSKVDRDEIMGEMIYRARSTGVIVGVLILLAAAASAFVYNRSRVKIFQELLKVERLRRESQERFFTVFYSIGDAIITTDPKGRVQMANPVAELLTGWQEDDARGKPLNEVVDIINPETRAAVENPAAKVLLTNRVEGMSNNTLLISRDGTERFITHCASPIREEDGSVSGVVLVFSDVTERKKAEAEVRRNRNMLEHILNSVPQAVFWKDLNSVYLGCNKVYALDLCLASPKEIVGKTDFDFERSKEYAERYIADDKEVMETHRPKLHILEKSQTRDGRQLWVDTSKVPLVDNAGHVYGVLGIFDDVTGRKKTEEKLHLQSEALEAAANAIVITDKQGVIEWANPAFTTITGYSVEEALGKTPSLLKSGKHEQAFYRALWETILAGKVWHGNLINRRKDGAFYDEEMTITPIRNTQGEIVHFIAVKQDVTQRNQERALSAASEVRYRRLFESAKDGILILDAETGMVMDVNPYLIELLGFPREDFLSKKVWELGVFKDLIANQANFVELQEKEYISYSDKPLKTHDGRQIAVEFISNVYLVNQQKVIQCNIRDISGRKQMEEKLKRTERMETIGTLASGVAHDLNNILTPIILSADMLRKTEEPNSRDILIDSIEECAQRGADVVKQVLTFARGTKGTSVPLQWDRLVYVMEKMMKESFPINITVTKSIPSDLWEVMGDPTQIHQVLLNLCINARDAMPEGGALHIAVENREIDENFAAMVPDVMAGDYVMMSITDSGVGIPREILGKIFDPFFTTKAIGKGTGLGLSTVFGVVRSHGGIVTAESEKGRGATFKVYLPAKTGCRKKPLESTDDSQEQDKGEMILLVEDDSAIAMATSLTLKNKGYNVLVARDGKEALAQFEKQAKEIKVVLTDVMMPGMSGVELSRALKEIDPKVKIVVSTGHATESQHAELQALGVSVILHKPYDAKMLQAALHKALHEGEAVS